MPAVAAWPARSATKSNITRFLAWSANSDCSRRCAKPAQTRSSSPRAFHVGCKLSTSSVSRRCIQPPCSRRSSRAIPRNLAAGGPELPLPIALQHNLFDLFPVIGAEPWHVFVRGVGENDDLAAGLAIVKDVLFRVLDIEVGADM